MSTLRAPAPAITSSPFGLFGLGCRGKPAAKHERGLAAKARAAGNAKIFSPYPANCKLSITFAT